MFEVIQMQKTSPKSKRLLIFSQGNVSDADKDEAGMHAFFVVWTVCWVFLVSSNEIADV